MDFISDVNSYFSIDYEVHFPVWFIALFDYAIVSLEGLQGEWFAEVYKLLFNLSLVLKLMEIEDYLDTSVVIYFIEYILGGELLQSGEEKVTYPSWSFLILLLSILRNYLFFFENFLLIFIILWRKRLNHQNDKNWYGHDINTAQVDFFILFCTHC